MKRKSTRTKRLSMKERARMMANDVRHVRTSSSLPVVRVFKRQLVLPDGVFAILKRKVG
jgi:hypothetical protein